MSSESVTGERAFKRLLAGDVNDSDLRRAEREDRRWTDEGAGLEIGLVVEAIGMLGEDEGNDAND